MWIGTSPFPTRPYPRGGNPRPSPSIPLPRSRLGGWTGNETDARRGAVWSRRTTRPFRRSRKVEAVGSPLEREVFRKDRQLCPSFQAFLCRGGGRETDAPRFRLASPVLATLPWNDSVAARMAREKSSHRPGRMPRGDRRQRESRHRILRPDGTRPEGGGRNWTWYQVGNRTCYAEVPFPCRVQRLWCLGLSSGLPHVRSEGMRGP